MTDLERQWEDLPVGPAPVEAILREVQRREGQASGRRPAQRLRRSLRTAAVLGGVAAAFVAGTLVVQPDGGGSGGPGGPGSVGGDAPADLVTPAAFHGALKAADSCEDLLASYVERGVDLVGAYGWAGAGYFPRDLYYADDAARLPSLPAAPLDAARQSGKDHAGDVPQTEGSFASDTGTNVQEAGVDEPDVVKTDGSLLVRLDGATLTTYDVSGARVVREGSVMLEDFHHGELLLAGDTVVAIGDDGTPPSSEVSPLYVNYGRSFDDPAAATVRQTRVVTVDVADPAAPAVVDTVDYDAATLSARQHGETARLVLASGLPDLDFKMPGRGRSQAQAQAQKYNRRLVERSTLDDWVPHVSTDGGEPSRLLDCADVALPEADLALGTMAVVGFDVGPDDTATPSQAIGVATDTDLAYESPDRLYLAAGDTGADNDGGGTTHLYDFALDETGARYVGDGEVEGRLADRWSLDEHDGVLRLAVEATSQTGTFSSVVTMRARGDHLEEVGRLDRLGVGEDLKSVRWFDDLAIAVTFRQVDPLFAIDLTHQARPRLLGELKAPGFSAYLQPLGRHRLVGIGEGEGPDGYGAQAALIKADDFADLRQLDVVHYPGLEAQAALDPRQLTWLPEHRVVLTVLSRYGSRRVGYVSTLHLGGDRMRNQMTQVEYGSDVDDVRLVPLPGERVALVTGDDVEFFDYEPR